MNKTKHVSFRIDERNFDKIIHLSIEKDEKVSQVVRELVVKELRRIFK